MSEPLAFFVHGTPAPQGSKRHVGGGRMVESSKAVKPWREAVKHAAIDALAGDQPFGAPVQATVIFYFRRPKGHYRTGKNKHLLADSAPSKPVGKPDIDKLLRSTFDALVDAGVITGDEAITDVTASKRFHVVRDGVPGAWIEVRLA